MLAIKELSQNIPPTEEIKRTMRPVNTIDELTKTSVCLMCAGRKEIITTVTKKVSSLLYDLRFFL